jgi:hypothetical protein
MKNTPMNIKNISGYYKMDIASASRLEMHPYSALKLLE